MQQLEWEVQQLQARLETQKQQLTQEIQSWCTRYHELQQAYEARRLGQLSGDEAALAQGMAVPINLEAPRPESQNGQPPTTEESGTSQPYDLTDTGEMLVGCGRCTATSRCECLEQAMDDSAIDAGSPGMSDPASNKQSHPLSEDESFADPSSHKRARSSLDLTASGPPPILQQDSTGNPVLSSQGLDDGSMAPADGCGFCEGSSTCPCAELAAQRVQVSTGAPAPPAFAETSASSAPLDFTFHNRLIPNPILPVSAGGSSSTAAANPSSKTLPTPPAGCGNDPGSCVKCRADPRGCGRFCKSLAASRTRNQIIIKGSNPLAKPCALGAACCRLVPPTESPLPISSSDVDSTKGVPQPASLTSEARAHNPSRSHCGGSESSGGATLTCAQAFAALSQHPAFPRAQRDLPKWLPRLTTMPNLRDPAVGPVVHDSKDDLQQVPLTDTTKPLLPAEEARDEAVMAAMRSRGEDEGGRTAFEIEAASVMGVMRYFDRVYGDRC